MLIASKERAQLLNEPRHMDGVVCRLHRLLESRSVRTQLLTPAQLKEALPEAPHARGDLPSVLLDLVQPLAVRSILGFLQQRVKALSRCVDEPDSLEHLAEVDRMPIRELMALHVGNERGEPALLRELVVRSG